MMKKQKAWFYEEYGPPEVLKLGEIPIPVPKEYEIVVQIQAAALNPIDFKLRRQLTGGARIDLPVIPGCDMSGIVITKGEAVLKFDIGDQVYGNIQSFKPYENLKSLGTLAQFTLIEESLLAKKPKNLSFEESAALPLALQTAIEGFKTADFKKGQSVFVVGGAGGIGSIVVQLAKEVYGASMVTTTTSTPKVDFVKSLGVDKVIDYMVTKYGSIEEKYDLVYDTIGDTKNSYVVAKDGMPIIDITWPVSNPRVTSSGLVVSGEVLEILNPYFESGRLKPVIDPNSPYHFNDIHNAFRYLETGRARGKVVISSFPS